MSGGTPASPTKADSEMDELGVSNVDQLRQSMNDLSVRVARMEEATVSLAKVNEHLEREMNYFREFRHSLNNTLNAMNLGLQTLSMKTDSQDKTLATMQKTSESLMLIMNGDGSPDHRGLIFAVSTLSDSEKGRKSLNRSLIIAVFTALLPTLVAGIIWLIKMSK